MLGSRMMRLGAASGIALAVMMVVGFALDMIVMQSTGGPPLLDGNSISSELLRAKGSTVWLVEGWLYTLMIVPAFVFVVAVYRVLHDENDEDSLARIGLFAAVLFWVFHTLHNAVMLTVLQVLVPGYASGAPQAASIEVAATTFLGLANILFGFGGSIGGLFLIGYLAAFGLATLRSSRLPRWTGYIALIGSFAVLLSYLQVISGVLLFVGLLGWVLCIVWVAGATVALLHPASRASMVRETAEVGAA